MRGVPQFSKFLFFSFGFFFYEDNSQISDYTVSLNHSYIKIDITRLKVNLVLDREPLSFEFL